MNIKTTLKSSVAAAALFAVVAPAHAGSISNGNDAMSVTLSGHFNKGMWYYNNGENSGVYQGDNGGSQSRARIIAKGKVNEAVSVSGVYEWAMTASNEATLDPADGAGDGTINGTEAGTDSFFTLRHGYVSFDHKQMGALKLGHTSPAGDGVSEVGGVGNLQYGTSMLFGGSVSLSNQANTTATGTDLGAYRVAVDGSRTSVIRYNTPSMAGFNLGVSHTNEQETGVEGSFSGKMAGFSISTKLAYRNLGASSTTIDNIVLGGVSVGHASGISADFNMGKQDLTAAAGRDPVAWAAGLVYKADLTSMGSTQFRAAYSMSEDAVAVGDELTGMMIGVDQGVADGVNIYAGYQRDSLDVRAAGTSYDDVSTIFAGTKIVF